MDENGYMMGLYTTNVFLKVLSTLKKRTMPFLQRQSLLR